MEKGEKMIKVRCRTNLDAYKGKSWPTVVACRPMVGDYVQVRGSQDRLKIVGITHVNKNLCNGHSMSCDPELILELR